MTTSERSDDAAPERAEDSWQPSALCAELGREFTRLGIALTALTPMTTNAAVHSEGPTPPLIWLGTCDTGTGGRLLEVLRGVRPRNPDPGTFVVDTRDGRVWQVVGRVGADHRLLPLVGGREWDCPPDHLRPATDWERKNADVCEQNSKFWRQTR